MKLGPYELGPNNTPENGIYIGDARELAKTIPDESVDLIFTDPPYEKKYQELYKWLPRIAERILKPDGFLLCYVPPYYKNIIFKWFDKYLIYFWDYIEYNKGNSTIIWPRRTISRYKSILAYRKNDQSLPTTNVLGVWPGGETNRYGDKRFHKWGQSEYTARYYIQVFKRSGIVFDPLVGGGTTAWVCKQLQMQYLAFEIDSITASLARARVALANDMLFIPQPLQLEMDVENER